jgi:hypothetical protein
MKTTVDKVKFTSRSSLFILILMATVFSRASDANSISRVRSSFDSQDPYEIVYKSDKNETDLPPGIYYLPPRQDNPEFVLAGDGKDVGRGFSGVLAQFPMTAVTKRYETFAIVNERLVLFGNSSRDKLPKSVLIFGENTPLIDALRGNRVSIEPITSTAAQNISIYVAEDANSQLFIVSVKQKNINGSGLTFAGALKRGTGALELEGQALVIDYGFHSTEELSRLHTEGNLVLSHEHLLSFARPNGSDDRIMRHYREFLIKLAKQIEPGKKTLVPFDKTYDPPKLNVATGHVFLTKLPVEQVLDTPVPIFQRIDPFLGRSGVFFNDLPENAAIPSVSTTLPGRIDYDERAHRYKILDLQRTDRKDAKIAASSPSTVLLVSIDNRIYMVFYSSIKQRFVATDVSGVIGRQIFSAKRISAVKTTVQVGNPANSYEHYLVISADLDGKVKGSTSLKILETADITKTVEVIQLSKAFYPLAEIKQRIATTEINGQTTVLFDNISERLKKPEDSQDEDASRSTAPLLNLRDSTSSKLRQHYLHPISIQHILGSPVVYRAYNNIGAIENRTGLYIEAPVAFGSGKSTRDPIAFLQGRILTEADQKGTALPAKKKILKSDGEDAQLLEPIEIAQEFDLESPSQTEGIRKMRASFIPYLPQNQEGRNSFELAMSVHSIGGLSEADSVIQPNMFSIPMPFEFSRFEGVKLVQGRRKYWNEFSLLVFVSRRENSVAHPSRGGAGIYAFPMTVQLQRDGSLLRVNRTVLPNVAEWLISGEVGPAAVRDRVLFESEGKPLWVLTPELQKSDRGYSLRQLIKSDAQEPKKFNPNEGFGEISIRHDETLEDSWDLRFNRRSRWIIERKGDIETRIPSFAKYYDDLTKKMDESGKKNRKPKRESIFPEFAEYVEGLADRSKPKEHTVLLVAEEFYSILRNEMMAQLVIRPSDSQKAFDLNNPHFKLHIFDPSFTPKETLENLGRIGRTNATRDLLYVDLEALLARETSEPATSYYADSKLNDLPEEEPELLADEQEAKDDKESAEETKELTPVVQVPELKTLSDKNRKLLTYSYSRLASLALEGDEVSLSKFSQQMPAPLVPTLILATPDQWRRMQDHFPQERKAGVFSSFKVDSRFLTASWTVWPPRSSRVSKEVSEFGKSPISRDEYQVFQTLETLLSSLATSNSDQKHQMLIVPEEIKPLITRLIMSRWATDAKELEGPWSYRNRDLALFQVSQGNVSQESIIDNYESIRGAQLSRKPVLLADMSDLLKIGRPSSRVDDRAFRIRDPITTVQRAAGVLGDVENGEPTEIERTQKPHILWWLAAEGAKIQPKKSERWTINKEVTPKIPTLIITTEKELQSAEQDLGFESRFMSLQDQFHVVRMEKPGDERKVALLNDLFRKPEIASLGYQFIHKELNRDNAQDQLLGLIIGRVEQISKQLKVESTFAFLKIYSALKRALTEDVELRRARQIDSSYLFRLFAKVFPLSLSYDILRPDDKLQRLRIPDEAARRLQELGYEGPLEMKTRVVRDLTQHTRGGSDGGRQIPSSLVLIGDSSSGKTFLFELTIKLLGLKIYDFSSPYEDDAEAFVLRVMDIVETDDSSHPEKLSIDKALAHLDNFLTKPNGWRGLILIDDLHKAASTVILSKLMTRMQSLFEAENGMTKVRSLVANGPGVIKEIPVRNLMIGVTLNPTQDLEKRKRFFKDFDRIKDPVKEAVASLSRVDYNVDPSFFSRVTDVIDMSEFPREAKVPSLLNKVRDGNMQEFSASPRVVLVTPRTLDVLVSQFPNSNARDFLNPATYSLLNLPNDLPKAPIYIVDPQPEVLKNMSGRKDDYLFDTAKVDPNKIDETLRKSTVVHAIQAHNPESKLHLLSFLVDNFRGSIYNSLILSAQSVPELGGNFESRTTGMVSFLSALLGNIAQYPRVPISYVNIRAQDLGVVGLDAITDLQKTIGSHASNANKPTIRIPSGEGSEERVDLGNFLGEEAPNMPERSRMDVLKATSHDIQIVVEKLLANSLHVSQLAALTDPNTWVLGLDESEPKQAFKDASQELIHIYLKFSADLYDTSLREMRNRNGLQSMQLYDEARLFLICLDSAISQLRWSYVTEFLFRAVNASTNNLSLGQKAGLQHLLFKSAFSPLTTVTPDSIVTSAKGISLVKQVDPAKLQRWHSGFEANCEKFLFIER